MHVYSKDEIIRYVEEEDVEFIRLQFTDMFGTMKNMAVTRNQLERAMNNKCLFDGSLIEGFARIEESDMYLYPDLSTFVTFPWRPQTGKVARFICDIYRPDGERFEGDPRYALQKVQEEAKKQGYVFEVGPECEFFLFNTDENGNPTTNTSEKAGYFDLAPLDTGENARRDIVLMLEDMGYKIISSEHEKSPAQHEIDFMFDEGIKTADNIQTFKFAVKTIARRHGLHATFMPKPRNDLNGSGMHLNFSLKKDGRNIFYSEDSKDGLSDVARYFIGGLMSHVDALTAVTNPTVNSYKRLNPGYDKAPVYTAWSFTNRTALIRVPSDMKEHTRIDFRCPDSSANPYLALAACLAAGLDGINNRIDPGDPVEGNIFKMTASEREANGIRTLPGSLGESIEALIKDELIKGVLGSDIAGKYIEAKRAEFADYLAHVSQWEVDEYLYKI
ncbi:MAG: type I glutamate--ammonia ligase [Lachnospiraceae bacterium]|nr:type I glutamate--ammonia ligase [Lachnospiraceae bacterium]